MSSENIVNEETAIEESKEFNFEESKESLDLTSKLKETSKCENSEVSTPTKKKSEARKLALAKARAARTLKAKQRRDTLNKLLIETSDEECDYIIKKVKRNTNTNHENHDNNNNPETQTKESLKPLQDSAPASPLPSPRIPKLRFV